MSEENTTEGGGKSKLLLIVGLVVVLLVGGGAGYYFMFMGGGSADADHASDEGKKKKKKKKKSYDDEDEDDKPASDADRALEAAIQDDEKVSQVIELQPFIVNLADKDEARYLRMTASLGIGGEPGGGHDPDPIFLAKVKNAMLAVLATKKADDVLTVKGKAKLRQKLLEAAQEAAPDGHIEALYITDFIVQM